VNWLAIALIYYVVIFIGLGGVLVEIFELLTWPYMVGMLVGCYVGHYLGQSSRIRGTRV
jgi:hypothetical protein